MTRRHPIGLLSSAAGAAEGGVSRRGFLTRAALAGGALVLPSGLLTTSLGTGCATAKDRRTPHYFLFYFLVGGWDLMLSTDPTPRHSDFWVPYDDDEVVEIGNERFGPAMRHLVPFVGKMALLRGVYCDALNHPQARFRMSTGRFKPPGATVQAPSVQTLLAQKYGAKYELPNLSSDALRPATFRGDVEDLRLEPVRVASVDQLRGLVGVKGDVSKYRREIQDAIDKKDALTRKHYDDGSSELPAQFDDFADLSRALLQSDYGRRVKDMDSVKLKDGDRWQKQAELAVEAIRQDLAPCVTVGSGEFDSHTKSEYGAHPAAVERGFRTVAQICKGLDETVLDNGETLLDRTTVVVTSEFSREPQKNELGGKHHWPTNACLYLGKGVRRTKGQPTVFGEVDDRLNAVQVNAQNGSKKRGADYLDMGHALGTALAMGGLDPVTLIGQDPITQLLG